VKDPVVFPVSAETALGGAARRAGCRSSCTHLTRFLAEERGRILLDNALGEGLAVAELLRRASTPRRSIQMKTDEIERRIAALEKDLVGAGGTIEQRRSSDPRGRVGHQGRRSQGPRALRRRRVPPAPERHRFRQARRAQAVPPGLPRGRLQAVGRRGDEGDRRAARAARREDGRARARGRPTTARSASPRPSEATRSGSTCRSTPSVRRRRRGAHVRRRGPHGGESDGGRLLAIAGPAIFAMFARGKIHEEFKKRAKSSLPT
jgi:hypothetical protein